MFANPILASPGGFAFGVSFCFVKFDIRFISRINLNKVQLLNFSIFRGLIANKVNV